MKKKYQIEIEKQDHFGRGLVRMNQIPTFIENGVAGDICEIEIIDQKKNYQIAKITKLLFPSNDRVEPSCPYYEQCGGCHLMNRSQKKQWKEKEQKVKELLERIAGIQEIPLSPILSKNHFFYRNKVIFHGKDNQLGFYQEKTNLLVPIDFCMIVKKEINEVYQQILEFLKANPHDSIQKVMIRTNSFQDILVAIEGNLEQDKILSCLDSVSSIYINQKLIKGTGYLIEDIFGMKFQIYPTSFFQVNYEMMLEMYRLVIHFYQKKQHQTVLDLYCGIGTIGMLISPYVRKVIGVEQEKSSIQSAKKSKTRNKIPNIEFLQGKVENYIDQFQKIDSIIVDPPRNGLDSYTIKNILKILPETITYISCDPSTLARDLKILSIRYHILKVHPLDMFPNTYHVECVVFLKRQKIFV